MAVSTDATDGFVSSMARLQDCLERDRGLIGRLEAVAALARRMIADCDAAGLSVVADGRAWSVAASDDVVLEVDLVQYDTGEGPCLEAIRTGNVVRLDVLDAADVYPHFAPGALDAGVETVLSLPAVWAGKIVGGLNLYPNATRAFRDDGSQSLGTELAAYAAESIVTSPLYAYSIDVVDEVIETLGAAEVIGQAIGILCAKVGYTPLDAMEELSNSARRGESLRQAAEWIIREQDVIHATDEETGDGRADG